MSRPHTARATVAITLELVVEVSGQICPAEPDVGISEPYIQDLTVDRVGAESNEPGDKVDWIDLQNPKLASPAPEHWLEASIIQQCKSQLEEKLFYA